MKLKGSVLISKMPR